MRRKTTTVKIGNIILSSEEPVIVQSMLNTSTMDTKACVEQAIRIIEAGGQLVRITAQGVKEAENLQNIHRELCKRGYNVPLSADIHFVPAAALVAAKYVEKVRINPGNFVDKRATFKQLVYTDETYAVELNALKEKFREFLNVCKKYHTAVRVGTNHGSLSDRIMSRYGNTPEGMVEATMEYLRVCREEEFNDVVISLKSSDCRVMVKAVRLLVQQMEKEGMAYPLHLGVTEAGEGEDGRIRSAVGIGCLLNEGLGDTIRVSLTEAPEQEIPVARTLVEVCTPDYQKNKLFVEGECLRPFLVADLPAGEKLTESLMQQLGFYKKAEQDIAWTAGKKAPEWVYAENVGPELRKLPPETGVIVPFVHWTVANKYKDNVCPLMNPEEFLQKRNVAEGRLVFVEVKDKTPFLQPAWMEVLRSAGNVVVVLNPQVVNYHIYRQMLELYRQSGIRHKVILRVEVAASDFSQERLILNVAAHVGGLFIDRLADGLWITVSGNPDVDFALNLGRNILQAVGLRRYKTEFVSCPGCGRTLYNLEDAVAKVKRAFAHLEQLKIAIMGCVVNGPGEMGDADYGYVGAGNGKVNLYKGKQMMKVAVPEEEAIEALRQLIKENGDWKEV